MGATEPGSRAQPDGPRVAGHRTLPHTADLRVEAWGPSRETCIVEAVTAVVESFVDVAAARPTREHRARLAAAADDDLLVAVLEELVYLLDTAWVVPVATELVATPSGADLLFRLADVTDLPQVGAVPKAVSLHGLRLEHDARGWSGVVTLDV